MKKLQAFAIGIFLLVVAVHFLVQGRQILIPIAIAIVIWYLIAAITHYIVRIPKLGNYLPYPLALTGALGVCFYAIWFVFSLVLNNIGELVNSAPLYQERLANVVQRVYTLFGIEKPPTFISDQLKQLDIVSLISNIASTLTDLAGSTSIILIYVLFLLLEQHSFDQKLKALIPDEEKLSKAQGMIDKILMQIESYLRIKTALSVTTALISYGVLKYVQVDFAEFWALMIFLFNYIPTIGSIIATILPCVLTLIQFETWTPFIFVTVSLTSLQIIMGNIIEPKVMGRSFNLSGLVILLSLSLWGQIWGITGMFLCVPIMVILNIILSNFPQTRPVAILMSQDGKVR